MEEDRTKENLKMLDKIDFTKFFDEFPTKMSDLRRKVEDYYMNTDFAYNEVMKGCIFNWVDDWDLSEYLTERYPGFRSYEETIHYYYIDK